METLLMLIGIYASLVLIFVTCIFLFAQFKHDNSIIDIWYGPTFAAATWGTLILTQSQTMFTYIIAGMVTLWALRLALHIAKKNWGTPEDIRYATWRTKWRAKEPSSSDSSNSEVPIQVTNFPRSPRP